MARPLAKPTLEPFSLASNGSPLTRAIDRLLGLSTLNELYRALPAGDATFCDHALATLDITYDARGEHASIPSSGPLVVVANHPHGALDGLVLASLLRRVRPDVKLLGNALLARIPELRDVVLFVDAFGGKSARRTNSRSVRHAVRWLERGGALVIFPAGEVSHVRTENRIVDSAWAPTAARIVGRTESAVVPVYFEGRNSALFHWAGKIHPLLRTALLPRELLRQRRRTVTVTVGRAIPFERLVRFGNDEEMTAYLRVRTYALAATSPAPMSTGPAIAPEEVIAAPEPSALVRAEIESLPPSQVLLQNDSWTVCIGRPAELSHTLREIGRLREISFRGTGEGTGHARDLDEFDRYYQHLFVWNRERAEIAGAYRVGPTDEILPDFGPRGLYTNTLFRYDGRLLAQIDPALELGRAFVRPQYQRDYSPLMLLWKGIAAFVAKNPRYRLLFGTVSISSEYQSLSRQILAQFLYATAYRRDLAELVTARNPPAFLRHRVPSSPLVGAIVKSIAEVGSLLAEIERDHKGVPVLLRQYLKLNARLLGFNVDPAFGNVLDGLMLVDLTGVDRAILFRYMGAAGTARFLAYHGAAAERRVS